MKKILVFVGHPDNDSFSGAIADAYVRGAKSVGHDVRVMRIADMKFDPILHKGYKVIQAYEPDLVLFQENVRWAEHVVFIFPIWWSGMPGIMKGFIERVWMPGFAYNFWKGLIPGWTKRLKGRSARLIVTSDSRPFTMWALFGTSINSFKLAVLWFSGFSPIRTWRISGMKTLMPARAQRILAKARRLGKKGK